MLKILTLCLLGTLLISPHLFAQETDTGKEVKSHTSNNTTNKKSELNGKVIDYQLKKYNAKFSEIEEKITELKENIFQSKRKLLLLKEQILHNVIAEARVIIVHKNNMGMGFFLENVIYFLDGERIYFADSDTADLQSNKEFIVYNGTVVPKNHILTVEMNYVGKSSLLPYLKGYRFKIKSSYTFFASKGKIIKLTVVGEPRGGIATEYVKKPYIKYKVKQFRYNKENLEKITKGLK